MSEPLAYKDAADLPSPRLGTVGSPGTPNRNPLRFGALEHRVVEECGRLAQSVERDSYKVEVAGSCPAPPTKPSRYQSRKEYQRNYQREWMRERRAAFFSDKCCEKCSSTDRLELHHRHPDEKVAHCIWSWSASRRDVEVAKCVVLCFACHKKLTSVDLSGRHMAGELKNEIGASGFPNVSWEGSKGKWRVEFRFLGTRVSIGGGGFKNIVTARLAAESFRKTLIAHHAKQNLAGLIACQKQLCLELAS